MKKNIIFGLIGLVVLVIIISVLSNPLIRSSKQIRKDLLKLTPVGTSMEDVLSVIENNKKWIVRMTDEDSGYFINENGVMIHALPGISHTVVGKKSIRVFLGKYFMGVYVDAWYGFDENSNLIDIGVFKEYDMI